MDYKSKFKIGDLVVVKKIPNEVWKIDTIHYGVVNFYYIINTMSNLPYFCAEFELEHAEMGSDRNSKFKVGDLVVDKTMPDAVFKVEEINYGKMNGYTVSDLQNGTLFYFLEIELEHAEPSKPELKLIGSKFKPGDIVMVDGYIGQFKVIECTGYEPMVEDVIYKLINIHTGEEVFGAEWDMKFFGKKNEIINIKLNVETGYIEQLPKKQPQPKKTPKHRTLEAGIISKLEYNRFLVEKGKQMIDDYLDLFSNFGDEKYLRRIKRINNFINKIPVRAFQIED
ncbi:hypothetical protein H1164_08150 [Thermoactinomyces daqus]|uniref:Uncharacterized protein n=1 Tax=Thermoactinomyces daqus TaxID=1329516 RepID=A0A7W1XA65_9BACL|nr:hypothetical protein [Thermoactinomyces daqus]MBA4542871.1 hypothetical protein [Thermoactinomyces daqus]